MPGDIAKAIDALQQMTTGELAERYEELYGQPVHTRHRACLIRKIAWRINASLCRRSESCPRESPFQSIAAERVPRSRGIALATPLPAPSCERIGTSAN